MFSLNEFFNPIPAEEVERRLKEISDRRGRMTPEERYRRDSQFKALVDFLEMQVEAANLTPTEMREAAILAVIHYEWRKFSRSPG